MLTSIKITDLIRAALILEGVPLEQLEISDLPFALPVGRPVPRNVGQIAEEFLRMGIYHKDGKYRLGHRNMTGTRVEARNRIRAWGRGEVESPFKPTEPKFTFSIADSGPLSSYEPESLDKRPIMEVIKQMQARAREPIGYLIEYTDKEGRTYTERTIIPPNIGKPLKFRIEPITAEEVETISRGPALLSHFWTPAKRRDVALRLREEARRDLIGVAPKDGGVPV